MIQIRNFTKKYKNKLAVDNLTMNIMPGRIHGFIGHNGAGKTTTLKAIVGIHDFDEGSITVYDKDVRKDALSVKQMLAYIPDNPDIYPYMKGLEYINFVCDAFKVEKDIREKRILEYAELLEISDVLNHPISSYSHGMRQKLVILASLAHDPKIMILDEPFVGLDPKAAHSVKQIMRKICDGGGCILFSTHVLEVAQTLCDDISIIKDGKLVVSGTTENVAQDKTLEEIFLELN